MGCFIFLKWHTEGENVNEENSNSSDREEKTAEQIISEECKGSINREFPSEMKDKKLKEIRKIDKKGNKVAKKALKLLNDKRFKK